MSVREAVGELQRARAEFAKRETALLAELSAVRKELEKVDIALRALAAESEEDGDVTVVVHHDSKYGKLGEHLRNSPRQPRVYDFTEIEQIAGVALPQSARDHDPHWYGYDNSALAKAIRNAGWKARKVNRKAETVELFPVTDWEHEMDECPVCFMRRRDRRTGTLVSDDGDSQSYQCGCGAIWSVHKAEVSELG